MLPTEGSSIARQKTVLHEPTVPRIKALPLPLQPPSSIRDVKWSADAQSCSERHL